MSESRQETVADIVAEMRKRECVTDYLRVLADRIEAACIREIETLRALVEGLLKASSVECASCGYDCGPRMENCITKQAIAYLEGHS